MAKGTVMGNPSDIQEQKEAEQKAIRRASIQSEIMHLNTRISNVNSQIAGLTAERNNLDDYLGDWMTQKTVYNRNDVISEVVITNVFEGACADKLKADIEFCVNEMDKTYTDVSGLGGHVGSQITSLNQYVETLNSRLTVLNAELSSL